MGKAFIFGDNIDTDVIIPARYLNTPDPDELKKFCMIDVDADFPQHVAAGDFIVAGDNFGCGSSREHAPLAIKAAGVTCVIARNFARIFYRNAFNIGLPILECAEAVERIQANDELTVDFDSGEIRNLTRQETYQAQPIPPFMQQMIADGGLVHSVRRRLSS